MTEDSNTRAEFVEFLLGFNSQTDLARNVMLANPKFTIDLAGSAISNFIALNTKYVDETIGAAGLFDAITVGSTAIEGLITCFEQMLDASSTFIDGCQDSEAVEYVTDLSGAMQTLKEGMVIMVNNLRIVQDTFNEPSKDYVADFNQYHAFYLAQKAQEMGEPESIIDEDTLQATLAEWINKEKK